MLHITPQELLSGKVPELIKLSIWLLMNRVVGLAGVLALAGACWYGEKRENYLVI